MVCSFNEWMHLGCKRYARKINQEAMGIDFTEKGFNITHEISMSGARYLVKTDVDIPNKFRLNGNYDVKVTDELRSDLKAS